MKLHRSHWILVAALLFLGTAGSSQLHAQTTLFFYSPMGPFVRAPYSAPFGYNYWYSNPYVAPYPAYGILPGPIVLAPWQYNTNQGYSGRTAEDYGYLLDTPARKRSSAYPAIPNQKSPTERQADIRRARFEIQVPSEDAVVLIDGAATKQSGLNRVYVTPPLLEDRLFTSEFEVRWTDGQGKMQSQRKTFEFVAGETSKHTFK